MQGIAVEFFQQSRARRDGDHFRRVHHLAQLALVLIAETNHAFFLRFARAHENDMLTIRGKGVRRE